MVQSCFPGAIINEVCISSIFQKQLDDDWILKIEVIVEIKEEFLLRGQMQTRFSILRFRINICTVHQWPESDFLLVKLLARSIIIIF